MMQHLWKSFPRELELRINNLLVEAEPTSAKAYKLYKNCVNEGLWTGTLENFSHCLRQFFSLARQQRRKSGFDQFLEKPMHGYMFDDFHLTFRSANISSFEVREIASWAHNLMRVNCRVDSAAISIDTLNKTILKLTTPGPFDKESDITFQDFCSSWKKMVGQLFGEKHQSEMVSLIRDLHRLDQQAKTATVAELENKISRNVLYLTQTEITWTEEVRHCAFLYAKIPKFPLVKGPQKLDLLELERMTTLYSLIQITDKPELLQHRESVRLTILDRCDSLLIPRPA